jgi:hypothetical protein
VPPATSPARIRLGPTLDLDVAPRSLAESGDARLREVGAIPELTDALRGDAEVLGDLPEGQSVFVRE